MTLLHGRVRRGFDPAVDCILQGILQEGLTSGGILGFWISFLLKGADNVAIHASAGRRIWTRFSRRMAVLIKVFGNTWLSLARPGLLWRTSLQADLGMHKLEQCALIVVARMGERRDLRDGLPIRFSIFLL
jgi:hypothetical protein